MGAIRVENQPIDVICQHTKDGKLIPLKIRLVDEDGEVQSFVIKGYRDYSDLKMKNAMTGNPISTSDIWAFDLRFQAFGTNRVIRVFYHLRSCVWTLGPRRIE
ncbi:MAG: hypothetical protein K5675_10145 [Lachnospiraceae bacterium]|nr:hypothetical protein [Lachnospiraceae bacterium]